MKQINLTSILTTLGICTLTFASVILVSAQIDSKSFEPIKAETKVTIREGQVIQWTIESPNEYAEFTIVNPSERFGDIDFVALDGEGNEITRSTEEIEPQSKSRRILPTEFFDSKELFSDDLFTFKSEKISSVWVQMSLRAGPEPVNEAAALPIAFFSQKNSQWGGNQIGTCKDSRGRIQTIAQLGCAITSVAMAGASKMSNSRPDALNSWLTRNKGGYVDGCSLVWSKAADFDGPNGFKHYPNLSTTVRSASNLKSLIDAGYYVVAYSRRFDSIRSTHWVVIYKYHGTGSSLGDFEYLDPIDTSYTYRTVNDAFVKIDGRIKVYK